MKEKLTNNLGLKILSVFLAFFVWLAVVNISNPEVTGSREVPLDILNEGVLESSNLTYEIQGGKNTVTVSYKVQTLDEALVKSSDFRAYIDLADLYEPTGAVPVYVEVQGHKNLFIGNPPVAKPGVVRVTTEDLQRKPFDLRVIPIGQPEEGYNVGTATISPTYVYVSGPVSKVGQISSVGIEIDTDNATSNLSGTAKPIFYDANDNKLDELLQDERVTLNRSEVDYELAILKVKTLPLDFETEGRVADGYRFTGVETNVNSVEVVGLKSTLAGITSIKIPKSELNMDGAFADKEVTVDLSQYLPEGVQLSGDTREIKIIMKVEPLENRTFVLNTSQIRLVGAASDYSYQYDQDSINVVVRGLKEDLDQLTVDNLEAELDVSNLEPGTHNGEVVFQLGLGYELVRYDVPEIIVHDKGPSTEESSSEVETEGPGSQPEETTDAETTG